MHFRSREGVTVGMLGFLSVRDDKVRSGEGFLVDNSRHGCIPCQEVLVSVILSFALRRRVLVAGSGSKRIVSRYEITFRSDEVVSIYL